MTEAEWLACTELERMLEFLRGKATGRNRKLRLFGVACCRRIWRLLKDDRSRKAVEASESFADKVIRGPELVAAQKEAMLGRKRIDEYVYPAENAAASVARPSVKPRWVAQLARWAVSNESIADVNTAAGRHARRAEVERSEMLTQTYLLRCIFGNPFRPSYPLAPAILAWHDATIRRLAEAIYQERAFERLPILADALVDAGCEQEELIGHCRSEEKHVRGCWGVDLILGRS